MITAGIARKPGMSRDDLLNINYEDRRSSAPRTWSTTSPERHPDRRLNPLDVMCQVAKVRGSRRAASSGMAGVLDTARYRAFIAMELGVSVENVTARSCSAATATRWCRCRGTRRWPGCRLPSSSPPDRIDAIVKRTAGGGAEIVALLKTGSAYYAPAASTVEMVDAILKDKHTVLPVRCYLEGEYGIRDLYVGVPVKLGPQGVEKIWRSSSRTGGRRPQRNPPPPSRSSSTS